MNISNTAIDIAGLKISNILYFTKPIFFCEEKILLFPIWKVNVLDIGTKSYRSEGIMFLKGQSIWILCITLGNTLYVYIEI